MKTIGINASFLRKPYTGIGQVTTHFLRTLIREEGMNGVFAKYTFILYLEEDIDWDLPENLEKRVVGCLWARDDLVRKTLWERVRLPLAARRDGCDAFISLYQCPTIFGRGMEHVMVVHDMITRVISRYTNNWRKRLYREYTERAIKRATKIVAISRRTEKDIIRYLDVPADRISMSSIDVDPIFSEPVSDTRSRSVMRKYDIEPGYIYYGGGLDVRKNAEGVMHAYRKILKDRGRYPALEHVAIPDLVISGKLMPQLKPLITDVEALAKELNISNHVHILGMVDQEDLPALYKNAKVFVFPSTYEGFGMTVLEAMRVGTPVITARTSSLPEVAGDAAMYCDPEDTEDIALVMARVLSNKALADEMVRRGRERAKLFSWKSFVEGVLGKV